MDNNENQNGLFDDNGDDQIEGSYLERLVGEGKKFQDAELLARGKWEADKMIERLINENKGMRQDLESRVTLEQVIDKIDKLNSSNGNDGEPNPLDGHRSGSNEANDTHKINEEEILRKAEELFERKLRSETEESRKRSNLDTAINTLKDNWGDEWQKELNAKAQELEVSKEFLTSLATQNPSSFLKIVGGTERKYKQDPNKGNPPQNRVNSNAQPMSGREDWDYFKKMRKEQPHVYWSPSTQRRIMELVATGKLPPR